MIVLIQVKEKPLWQKLLCREVIMFTVQLNATPSSLCYCQYCQCPVGVTLYIYSNQKTTQEKTDVTCSKIFIMYIYTAIGFMHRIMYFTVHI